MKVQSINPTTGELIKEFQSSSKQDVNKAVEKARKAQKNWAQLSLEQRALYFKKLKKVLQDNTQQILTLMKDETGKRIPDAEAEVYDVIDAIDYYRREMAKIQPDFSVKLNAKVFPETDFVINYLPYGVTGLIMPWNFPFYVPAIYIITSLMAGNAVVFKPSEYSTLVGLKIQEQFKKAGFPEWLVEVIIGADETGKLLVKSQVDKIFFVGSVEAGRDILAKAGIKPAQVEAGGNSAALVLEDADIELAVKGVSWGGTYHAGQDCVGIKRVFVVESIADKFLSKLVDDVRNLRPGIDYGPYIRKEVLETVKQRIDDAVKKGAKLLCGGKKIKVGDGGGYWLTPSVLTYTDESLELVAEETFGNTIPVMVVKDTEIAIEKANNTKFGLSNAVFTKDIDKAKKVAARLESGMVFINDPLIAIPGWDHWTGWKNSGFGTPESKIMQCLKKKIISVNKHGQARSFWYPYPEGG